VPKVTMMDSAGAGTLYLVHVLTHASRSRLDAALSHLDLSSFQYTALSVLAHNENLSSARLSQRFFVTPQAMGELILVLERRGLIERREDVVNRKALLLSLTERGRSIWSQADAIAKKIERNLFGGLSNLELETFRSILSNALTILREQSNDRREASSKAGAASVVEHRRSVKA
jgi:DNA-binding MarR family transcriptional regulator